MMRVGDKVVRRPGFSAPYYAMEVLAVGPQHFACRFSTGTLGCLGLDGDWEVVERGGRKLGDVVVFAGKPYAKVAEFTDIGTRFEIIKTPLTQGAKVRNTMTGAFGTYVGPAGEGTIRVSVPQELVYSIDAWEVV